MVLETKPRFETNWRWIIEKELQLLRYGTRKLGIVCLCSVCWRINWSVPRTHCTMECGCRVSATLFIRYYWNLQPSGLLVYLDSDEEVPENAQDLLHVRDNLKSAIVSAQRVATALLRPHHVCWRNMRPSTISALRVLIIPPYGFQQRMVAAETTMLLVQMLFVWTDGFLLLFILQSFVDACWTEIPRCQDCNWHFGRVFIFDVEWNSSANLPPGNRWVLIFSSNDTVAPKRAKPDWLCQWLANTLRASNECITFIPGCFYVKTWKYLGFDINPHCPNPRYHSTTEPAFPCS